MTDREWLLSVLADGREHSLADLLARSVAERGCGLTVHSRVAELRKHGHVVEHRRIAGFTRGYAHLYRLASSPRQELPYPHDDASPAPGASLLVGGGSCSGGEGGLPVLVGRHGVQGDPGTGIQAPRETPFCEVPRPGFASKGDALKDDDRVSASDALSCVSPGAKPGSPLQLAFEVAA